MHAQVGDTIHVESQAVGRAPRSGRILETIAGTSEAHYLVRWSDGQESFYYPGPDGHVVDVPQGQTPEPAAAPRRLHLSGSVRAAITSPPLRVGANDTLREVAARLADSDAGALLVFEADELVGVVSERDVVRSLARGADPDEVWAADVAPADIVCAAADDTIIDAADTMSTFAVRQLPVRENGRICGVVSARDILATLLGSPVG